MAKLQSGINLSLPDASFDLDGTVFKMTILEAYVLWLCEQGVFAPLPPDIAAAKRLWKNDNTEHNYTEHLGKLVKFFIQQIPGQSVSLLTEAAHIVAGQQRHRRWNVTAAIIAELGATHNLIAVSLMPEWLMKPFTEDLGFNELVGSTYVAKRISLLVRRAQLTRLLHI